MSFSKLVLASASPRRSELLKNVGLSFQVRPAEIDETVLEGETPQIFLERIVKSKVFALPHNEGEVVIAADTIVVYQDRIFGKPVSEQDAFETLSILAGKTHQVYTGYYIHNSVTSEYKSRICSTNVTFFDLNNQEINNYIKSREPFGKAGSYAIQGIGSFAIEKIEGCYNNVVGLPVSKVIRDLASISDIKIFND